MKFIKALLIFLKVVFSNYQVCQLLHLQTIFCRWGKKSFPAVALGEEESSVLLKQPMFPFHSSTFWASANSGNQVTELLNDLFLLVLVMNWMMN